MLLRKLQTLPEHTAGSSLYYILAVVCSAMFLDLANLSAITIALPTIQKDFGINVSNLQCIISAYALTFGGFLLLGGRGGDIFGSFQGIGAAFTIPSAQAHIALHFTDPARKAKALGIWGAAGPLGFIIGLILGGVTAFLGWRWIFYISIIISGSVIPAAYVLLPRHGRLALLPRLLWMERLVRFDARGISLGISGILLLTYALTSANAEGWDDSKTIATLAVSAVLLVVFIIHERVASQAILAPHLFRNLSFNLTLILALQSYGASAIHTSVLFIPPGVSALIFNTLSGRLVPILGARAMNRTDVIVFCSIVHHRLGALSISGILLFSSITEYSSYWRYTFPGMILYIAGIGAVYITANFVLVSSASRSDQGAAAGVFNVALQVGDSILGLAVLTAVAEGIEKKYGDANLPQGELSGIGYKSVYYSCVILSGIGLFLGVFTIQVPASMRGSMWKKPEASTPTEPSSSHELQPVQSQQC
ncbi:hypothetical protein PTNB85_00994 [Pyrenophora teres f. teres]|nr:hypothetical protein PTNB85_00994 [Pyrenophora teres f. teres]